MHFERQSYNQHLASISMLLLSILLITVKGFSESSNIQWQDAAIEVDQFPFCKTYIDSIKIKNKITPIVGSLREVSRRIICPSETLVYEVTWGPITAGHVVLTAQPDSQSNTIRLGGKALSNNFIGTFYRMRDYVISTVDSKGLYPLMFEQHLREGKKYKNDGWILYDHIAGKVYVQEKKFKTLDAPKFVHDYVSILYYVRNLKPMCNDTFTLNLFIHSKVYPIFIKCKEKKTIQVEAGIFNCISIEPKLVGEGAAFNKRDKLEIWLTDDQYRIPVLIKSKIKFGVVSAKLIWNNHIPVNNKS